VSTAARPTLVTIVLSVAAVAGYLAYRAATVPSPAILSPAPGAMLPMSLADQLPEFELANLAGEFQSIRSWPGEPMIINFWATWCAPCLREIPLLKTLQDENPWLTVVGIAIDRRPAVLEFAEEMGFNYPVLQGESEAMEAAASFGTEFVAMPFTVFADGDGRLLGVHTGELHAEDLENIVAVLDDRHNGRIDVRQARERIAGLM
jgi:thiol-disulfide isomerase/thioredoxin